MQILTLMGSPRKHGNTDAVLHRFETIATDAGHTVVRMNVTEYEVAGCLGCDGCQGDLEDFGCLQADACEEILRRILSADLTVYASPGLLLEFLRPNQSADRSTLLHREMAGR